MLQREEEKEEIGKTIYLKDKREIGYPIPALGIILFGSEICSYPILKTGNMIVFSPAC